MGYLDHIRDSKQTLCAPARTTSARKNPAPGAQDEPTLSPSQSSVDCYTAPYVPVGFANKASISLCRSRNLVLSTCDFFAGRRKGTLNKKFPMPARGAVKLGCNPVNHTQLADRSPDLAWLKSIHHEVWWSNATRDERAVGSACGPASDSLVTTPTLFVMRDRHANYAHEMEVVSMAFSFLAALEPQDVAAEGLQVVIVDQAPPTGFLESWARLSRPHRLRILAHDPFPPNTCFRSAYHVYTFAAGIGYNTNGDTASCDSPVGTGLSHWLRQLYDESDLAAPAAELSQLAAPAGPAAAEAGLRGMRPPTSGIVMKNVVWLSRRNLELVRLLLNASVGWKSMRMVRNEDEVVAGILEAVTEWNAESCLLRRFERDVKKVYEESLNMVNAVHLSPGDTSGDAAKVVEARRRGTSEAALNRARRRRKRRHSRKQRSLLLLSDSGGGSEGGGGIGSGGGGGGRSRLDLDQDLEVRLGLDRDPDAELAPGGWAAGLGGGGGGGGRTILASTAPTARIISPGGGDIDEHGDDDDGEEEEEDGDDGALTVDDPVAFGEADSLDPSSSSSSAAAAADGSFPSLTSRSKSGKRGFDSTKMISWEELWSDSRGLGNCRRSNVLFKFVDGDFNDMPYHQQLKLIFRTGVLAGVHGAGLTHGFFMPPGQSAVLQLLGDSFAKVAANNVFRNMAVGLGNLYEDVPYVGVDVEVSVLKQAVKRAMDFVSQRVVDTQLRQNSGALPPLELDDQNHFSVVIPPPLLCPRNRTTPLVARHLQHRSSRRV